MSAKDLTHLVPDSFFRQVVESCTDGILITGPAHADRPVLYANPAFERMTGYRADDILGKSSRILHGEDKEQPDLARLRRAVADELPCSVLLRNYRKDGSLFWNELSLVPFRNAAGDSTHFIEIQKDVTRRVRLEKTLLEHERNLERAQETATRIASKDATTNVANRRAFLEMLSREWRRAARETTSLAVLLVDLDSFKRYNTRHGGEAGDEALARVAQALEGVLKRPADTLARFGGDEFAALLPQTDAAGAEQVAVEMLGAIRSLGNGQAASDAISTLLTVSIGGSACVPQSGCPAHELVGAAEVGLARAKEAGRDCVRLAEFTGERIPVTS
jgi:diguanylate cyclase (GGDEF)-like protein/PAS domain S-box-containing protein